MRGDAWSYINLLFRNITIIFRENSHGRVRNRIRTFLRAEKSECKKGGRILIWEQHLKRRKSRGRGGSLLLLFPATLAGKIMEM